MLEEKIKERFEVKITRREFLALPMETRRRILAEQAIALTDLLPKGDEEGLLTDEELDAQGASPSYIAMLINQGINNALKAQKALDDINKEKEIEGIFKEIESQFAAKDYTGRKRSVSFVLECKPWQSLKAKYINK